MKVKVYWNFHKKLFSVQHKGLVINHLENLYLINVDFLVGQGGRARVIKEESKNVHAYAVGDLLSLTEKQELALDHLFNTCGDEATYDPYKYKTFVRVSDESPVFTASFVNLRTVDRRSKIYIFSSVEADKIFGDETVLVKSPGEKENDRHAHVHSEVPQYEAIHSVG
jgi:hypothetical protein